MATCHGRGVRISRRAHDLRAWEKGDNVQVKINAGTRRKCK